MFTRILAIARKEAIHIRRDRRTLVVVFLIPIVQLMLMGYTATNDLDHMNTAVLDADRTRQSRDLISAYTASSYFNITAYVSTEAELGQMLDNGTVRAALIIPAGYGRDIAAGRQGQVSFIIDGSEPTVANTIFASSQQVGQAQTMIMVQTRLNGLVAQIPGVDVRPRVWYNPDMRSANFMIPGVMCMILFFTTINQTSMAIVRERERGTIEQLIVTPIRPLELIIGKVMPYAVIAFFNVLEVLLLGFLWFEVPLRGSLPLLLGLSAMFLLASLSLGLLISTISNTQQESMTLSILILLPSVFLSGFFFPLEAMPYSLQILSHVVPLRYYLIIIRGIVLKGIGLSVLWPEVATVAAITCFLVVLASRRFRATLD